MNDGQPDAGGTPIDESELRARLTPIQFEVTQRAGTERPFTGEYWIAMSYGTSWMAPAEVGGKWVLANANFGAGSE